VNEPLRVLLVDDHPLVRTGLASVIATQPWLLLCGEAGTSAQALKCYRSLRPDVVLMDMRLPELGGAATTRAICQEFPGAKVLVISSFNHDEDVYSAIKAGALGYVLKTIEAQVLMDAIRTVSSGKHYLPVDVAAHLAARIRRSELTERERDVLSLVVRGHRNRSIAQELQISERCAKAHVGNILEKLGVSDRTAVVQVAVERGLVTLG